MASHVVLKEQTLPRDVRRVLPVLVVIQLLTGFPRSFCLRVVCGLLCESKPTNRSLCPCINLCVLFLCVKSKVRPQQVRRRSYKLVEKRVFDLGPVTTLDGDLHHQASKQLQLIFLSGFLFKINNK